MKTPRRKAPRPVDIKIGPNDSKNYSPIHIIFDEECVAIRSESKEGDHSVVIIENSQWNYLLDHARTEWRTIKKRTDLPKSGKRYLVCRFWQNSKTTIETAYLGLYGGKKRWVNEKRDELDRKLSGNEYPFENVCAWAEMPEPCIPSDLIYENVRKLPGNCS